MLSLDALRAFGANVDEGLNRCMKKEDFYFRLIKIAVNDKSFDNLKAALDGGDFKAAFEAAHALKGVMGNLALTPIYEPAAELTDLLRPQKPVEYKELLGKIISKTDELKAIIE